MASQASHRCPGRGQWPEGIWFSLLDNQGPGEKLRTHSRGVTPNSNSMRVSRVDHRGPPGATMGQKPSPAANGPAQALPQILGPFTGQARSPQSRQGFWSQGGFFKKLLTCSELKETDKTPNRFGVQGSNDLSVRARLLGPRPHGALTVIPWRQGRGQTSHSPAEGASSERLHT